MKRTTGASTNWHLQVAPKGELLLPSAVDFNEQFPLMDTRGWGFLALKELQVYPRESAVATFDAWGRQKSSYSERRKQFSPGPNPTTFFSAFLNYFST